MTPQKASSSARPTVVSGLTPRYPRLCEMISTAPMMNKATITPGMNPAANRAGTDTSATPP